jgi:hypothetical protein
MMALSRLTASQRSLTTSSEAPCCFQPLPAWSRHANFAVEPIGVPFDGGIEFGGAPAVCTIPINGELLHKTYIVITLPRVTGVQLRWCTDVGLAIIDKVVLTIGGEQIDTQTGEFMHIWNALVLNRDEASNLSDMVNAEESWQVSGELAEQRLYVPLNMSFCEAPEAALPLGCLDDVQLTVHTRPLADMLEGRVDEIHGAGDLSLLCDYVYLQRNTNPPYHYTSTQMQVKRVDNWQGETELDFTGDCAELFVVCRSHSRARTDTFNFADWAGRNPVKRAVLTHDGDETVMSGKYMNTVQPFQHHTGRAPVGVNVFSYALRPEDPEPSGCCNLARVNKQTLKLDLSAEEGWGVTIYARMYTQLAISPGRYQVYFSDAVMLAQLETESED